MKLAIPQQVAQALLDYLVQRPYREVYQLVAALQRLEPVERPEQPDTTQEEAPAT